jgi:twitching motility protein PilT
MAIAALLTQTLLPKVGGGVVPAAELLMVGYGARQHIRKNALQHLHQEITITRRYGSFTFEESLARLVKEGLVEWRDAQARAVHVEEFEQWCPSGASKAERL